MEKRFPATNYKALKEAHVSGHSGGSEWEINLVALVAPAAILLWSALQSRLRLFTPYSVPAALVEFLLNCFAILSAVTVYASNPGVLIALLVIPALCLLVSQRRKGFVEPKERARPPPPKDETRNSSSQSKDEAVVDSLPIKPFLTMYRGGMMIITCAGILAVDFRIFPRRFAKVENWGTSLMDMGVGSFVFSAGLVSARGILKARSTQRVSSALLQSIRHSIPLLLLGFVRLWSVKKVDYAEHVTEYGVHWNFFFTLGFLPPFVALFNSLFAYISSYALLSLLVGLAYELVLNNTHLTAFIITGQRDTLLAQNREGIFSFSGYLSIFLAGQATGMYVIPREPTSTALSTSRIALGSTLKRLLAWTIGWSSLYVLSTAHWTSWNFTVSRRLANLPYILWVASFNTSQIALLLAIERISFGDLYSGINGKTEQHKCRYATSTIMHAFNRNGLAVFLLANLLTGLINLSMPTLHMNTLQAMGVLVAYMGVLSGVALLLDYWDVSIKI